MSDFKTYFRKFGGFNLIKQYFRTGVLGTAIMQLLILGKCKTALEILRLSVSLKVKKRLANKYRNVLDSFDKDWNPSIPHNDNRTVWIFWWQGIDNAPDVVKVCYESVKRHHGSDWKIVLLTEQNYKDYVTFPTHIIDKFQSGAITITHFSDLLRLELLINHGGLWLDATVYCSGNNIPKSIIESDLFAYMAQKPGADGKATTMSSWLMYAKSNSKILMGTRQLLYEYWTKNTSMTDYFLLHQFFSIVCDRYSDDANRIPPFCNSVPHILQLHLFDRYDEVYWEDLKKMTCFHKLTYKLDKNAIAKQGTYYTKLIQMYYNL